MAFISFSGFYFFVCVCLVIDVSSQQDSAGEDRIGVIRQVNLAPPFIDRLLFDLRQETTSFLPLRSIEGRAVHLECLFDRLAAAP